MTIPTTLPDFTKMTREELLAHLTKLEQKGNTIKVSEKGAVSLYGMGKWPVTLYKQQWEKLFSQKDSIMNFIKENESKLAVKQ